MTTRAKKPDKIDPLPRTWQTVLLVVILAAVTAVSIISLAAPEWLGLNTTTATNADARAADVARWEAQGAYYTYAQLEGAYTATIVADLTDEIGGSSAEAYALNLTRDGHYTITRGNLTVAAGAFDATASSLTFHDETAGCAPGTPSAEYAWEMVGSDLVLTAVGSDACSGRTLLARAPWAMR